MTVRERAREIITSCAVLQLALRHPRTPWYAKACGGITLLYALSPIDLIPDFIPALGYLDDLILVSAGLWLTTRLIPTDVWVACRIEAQRQEMGTPPKDWRGAVLIAVIWVLLLAGGALILYGLS